MRKKYIGQYLTFQKRFNNIKEYTKICTGSQKEAMHTPNAKTDIHRQGKKYGNLHQSFRF